MGPEVARSESDMKTTTPSKTETKLALAAGGELTGFAARLFSRRLAVEPRLRQELAEAQAVRKAYQTLGAADVDSLFSSADRARLRSRVRARLNEEQRLVAAAPARTWAWAWVPVAASLVVAGLVMLRTSRGPADTIQVADRQSAVELAFTTVAGTVAGHEVIDVAMAPTRSGTTLRWTAGSAAERYAIMRGGRAGSEQVLAIVCGDRWVDQTAGGPGLQVYRVVRLGERCS